MFTTSGKFNFLSHKHTKHPKSKHLKLTPTFTTSGKFNFLSHKHTKHPNSKHCKIDTQNCEHVAFYTYLLHL